MRLYLKNIGKLKEADIKLEGITVVAGENNSGKSTVGKALYSVYNTFYDIECNFQERIDNLREEYFDEVYSQIKVNFDDVFFEETESASCTCFDEVDKLDLLLSMCYDLIEEGNQEINEHILLLGRSRQLEIECLTINDLAIQYLKFYLKQEFNNQVTNLFSENKSVLQLFFHTQSDEDSVAFHFVQNIIDSFEGTADFPHEAVYLDDPFILDEPSEKESNNSHRQELKELLKKSPDKNQALEQILTEKKLKNILALLNKVCDGELSFQNTVTYRLGKTGKSLDIKNLSTGLKSFAILKTLLLNGSLKSNSILILDEPEIHLHPEWQLVYAELIVLLQKEFKLTILLTTHSPYFLRALEVYAEVHKVSDKCNYYFAKNEGQEAMIYDVTEDKSEVFQKLSRPLQELENLRWQNEE